MKNKLFIFIYLSCFYSASFSQIKVINNGYVAIGINYPNYPLHAYGWGQLFNYNGMEIKFRANNGNQSDIGSSNTGLINFWNSNCWANGGWNKLKANQFLTVSDQRLKQNISPLTNNLSIIKRLHPKQYNFIDSITTAESSRLHYGFLAQDIQQVLPNLVDTSRNVYAIDYTGIIPFLVGALKEQSSTIDSLRNAINSNMTAARGVNQESTTNKMDSLNQQIKSLQNQINYIQTNCCQSSNSSLNQNNLYGSSTNSVNLNTVDNSSAFLLQNIPNPFDNSTLIKFNIPEKYDGKFFIKVYTLSGEERISYQINKSDKQLLITSGNLASGMYLYALIANNDVLGVKQMVISK